MQTAAPLLAIGWLALFFAVFFSDLRDSVLARIIPMVAAGTLILSIFGVLGPDAATGAFLCYLAVTLLFGAWQFRRAMAERMHPAILLPCLGLTFFYPPSGLIAFAGMRLCRSVLAPSPR